MSHTRRGCEVPVMMLLRDLKGAMWFDRTKDVSVCFNLHHLWYQCIYTSCVEVVVLIICVCFYVLS